MYQQFLADAKKVNPHLRIIGFTATPFRLKEGEICAPENILNTICYEVGIKELIRDGFLCPLISKSGKEQIDFGSLHIRAGEFVADEVEALMDSESLVESVCREIVEYSADRNAVLIFSSGVRHGNHIVDTSYRLIGKDQYELVAPGGELKHGNLGNESYSNRADTYGLMMAVDRRDIINDDLGAITTVPRKLGRGSGLKINDVFWTVFLANSGFFTVGNKNFLSGTDTVLSIDGLTKAEVAYYDLVDSDGKPIGTMPAIMLGPTALSAIGSQLYKSLEMRDSTANARVPITNPHVGKFRVEVSRYLANALYTGNSSKAWYLITDPNDLPLIEVAFLNGQEAPTIETADADFNVLGVQMRGYHDFGVALQDPRAAIKCKGEA